MTSRFRRATLGALALLLAACGDDRVAPDDRPDNTADNGVATVELPADPDVPVLHLISGGGLMTAGSAFAMPAMLVVTAGGTVYTPGVTTAEYPGKLVRPTVVRQLSADGLAKVMAAARDGGFLQAPPEYPMNVDVMDGPSTVLTLTDAAGTYVHDAYALGITPGDGPETQPARARLEGFVDQLEDLAGLVGAGALGPESVYEPGGYRVTAMFSNPITDNPASPTLWPADAGVDLADVDPSKGTWPNCALVSADKVGKILTEAAQNDLFVDDGDTYQVYARPAIPGDRPCPGESANPGSTTTQPPSSEPASAPSGADAPFVRIERTNGAGPNHTMNWPLPEVVVTGGYAYRPAPFDYSKQQPIPLIMGVDRRPLTAAGVDALRGLVGALHVPAGRLPDPPVFDDGTAIVTIWSADGVPSQRSAYALHFYAEMPETEPSRVVLQQFAMEALKLTGEGSPDVGPAAPFEATEYIVSAYPIPPDYPAEEVTEVPVELLDLAAISTLPKSFDTMTCATTSRPETLEFLRRLTARYARQGGQLYILNARMVLPGEPPCRPG